MLFVTGSAGVPSVAKVFKLERAWRSPTRTQVWHEGAVELLYWRSRPSLGTTGHRQTINALPLAQILPAVEGGLVSAPGEP
jgi:hypothetical protein